MVFTDELFQHIFDVILTGNRPVRAVVGRSQPDIPATDAKLILAAGDFLEEVGGGLTVNLFGDGELRPLLALDIEQRGEVLDAGFVRLDNPIREPALALRLHEQPAIPLEPHQELCDGICGCFGLFCQQKRLLLGLRVVLGDAEKLCHVVAEFVITGRQDVQRQNQPLADLSTQLDSANSELAVTQELKFGALRHNRIYLNVDDMLADLELSLLDHALPPIDLGDLNAVCALDRTGGCDRSDSG